MRLTEAFGEAGVVWAADGATALAVHGLAVPSREVCVVLQDGPELRQCLTRWMVRGYDPFAGRSLGEGWSELGLDDLQRFLPPGTWVVTCPMEARVEPVLPRAHPVLIAQEDAAPVAVRC